MASSARAERIPEPSEETPVAGAREGSGELRLPAGNARELQARLVGAVDAARAELEHASASGDRERLRRAELALREAELGLHLYNVERDQAGALKFKRFARETVELFEPAVEHGERPTVEEAERSRTYLFVNMGELDRLNREGGHAAGDAGLTATAEMIDRVVGEAFGDDRGDRRYFIIRYSGNEFCVQFDNVPEAEAAAIEETLRARKLALAGYPQIEAPPLSTARFSFGEVMDTVRSAELELPEGMRAEPGVELGREAMGALRRTAEFNLEVEKYVARAYRVIEKLEEAGSDAGKRAAAQEFFDNYLKKMFQGTGLDAPEEFEAVWEHGPAAFERAVHDRAIAVARGRFAADREFQKYERQIIAKRCGEWDCADRTPAKVSPAFDAAQPGVKLAELPERTEGLDALRDAEAKMKRSEGTEEHAVERLRFLIETARRDALTGLLERGAFYEDLERDTAEGREVSVAFIDMGFLKYFDQRGGREVGNGSIRLAASLIERAIRDARVEGAAYRYGGDEFAVRIEGGEKAREDFAASLARLRTEAGAVPGGEESEEDYLPETLVFNIGNADTRMAAGLMNDLRDAGKLAPLLESRGWTESELAADLVVKLADAGVNVAKGADRLRLLIDRMSHPDYANKDSTRHRQVEALIRFSQKAIYSDLGGDAALRFFAEGAAEEDPKVLKAQIERFVADRVERAATLEDGKQELMDTLIELHATIGRLKREIGRAAKDRERLAELQVRYEEAERARVGLVGARETLKAVGNERTGGSRAG